MICILRVFSKAFLLREVFFYARVCVFARKILKISSNGEVPRLSPRKRVLAHPLGVSEKREIPRGEVIAAKEVDAKSRAR